MSVLGVTESSSLMFQFHCSAMESGAKPHYCQNIPPIRGKEECLAHCQWKSMTDGADVAITSNKEYETIGKLTLPIVYQ